MTAAAQPNRSITFGSVALATTQTIEKIPLARGFAATVNGLIVEGSPSLELSATVGQKLRVIEKGAQFAIGDWLIYLESRFGEAAAQIIDPDLGWSERTLDVYRWLAGRIAPDLRRMDRLGIKHHLLVAKLPPAKQQHWLTKAADDLEADPWTASRLKKAMEAGDDLPIDAWYVLVKVATAVAQRELMERLDLEGMTTKAIERRKRKAAEPESAAST